MGENVHLFQEYFVVSDRFQIPSFYLHKLILRQFYKNPLNKTRKKGGLSQECYSKRRNTYKNLHHLKNTSMSLFKSTLFCFFLFAIFLVIRFTLFINFLFSNKNES